MRPDSAAAAFRAASLCRRRLGGADRRALATAWCAHSGGAERFSLSLTHSCIGVPARLRCTVLSIDDGWPEQARGRLATHRLLQPARAVLVCSSLCVVMILMMAKSSTFDLRARGCSIVYIRMQLGLRTIQYM
jgi:hypothetical protein